MKLYTKAGDKGKTSIIGKSGIDKDDLRIEAYGTVDELNTQLATCRLNKSSIQESILTIQHLLFELGSELASEERRDNIAEKDIEMIEKLIDQSEAQLPKLTSFILPGGNQLSCALHVSRAICRRAERRVVSLAKITEINPLGMAFLNRLSDLLFSWSRLINLQYNLGDTVWLARK